MKGFVVSKLLWPFMCMCWFHLHVGTVPTLASVHTLAPTADINNADVVLTSVERSQLLNIDAVATGSVVPSSDFENGELSWSLSPSQRASITETGKWFDLPNNTLTFT